MSKMEAAYASRQADNAQTPIVVSTTRRSYGTHDVEMGSAQDEISSLFDVTWLLRAVVITLAFASLVFHFVGKEYNRILNILAGVTALTLSWNICIVLVTTYSPHTWKRRSDDDDPQKLYRRLAPLNDAWLSSYIFMFTLWAKLVPGDQKNGRNSYKVDAVFILNCAIFIISFVIAVFEQFKISWSGSLCKLVLRDSYHRVQIS